MHIQSTQDGVLNVLDQCTHSVRGEINAPMWLRARGLPEIKGKKWDDGLPSPKSLEQEYLGFHAW